MTSCLHRLAAAVTIASALSFAVHPIRAAAQESPPSPDHFEPHAWLDAPFLGASGKSRNFTLNFVYPDARVPSGVLWTLDLRDAKGAVQRSWEGEDRMYREATEVVVPWDGRDGNGKPLADGYYAVTMSVISGDPLSLRALADPRRKQHAQWFSRPHEIVQTFDVQVGNPPAPWGSSNWATSP